MTANAAKRASRVLERARIARSRDLERAGVSRTEIRRLLSALRVHGLTTQNPFEVWPAIDRKAWRPRTKHPPLRLVYTSGPALRDGVEEHVIAGVKVRVFSAAKTVADCFKFRNKIGTDVAIVSCSRAPCG